MNSRRKLEPWNSVATEAGRDHRRREEEPAQLLSFVADRSSPSNEHRHDRSHSRNAEQQKEPDRSEVSSETCRRQIVVLGVRQNLPPDPPQADRRPDGPGNEPDTGDPRDPTPSRGRRMPVREQEQEERTDGPESRRPDPVPRPRGDLSERPRLPVVGHERRVAGAENQRRFGEADPRHEPSDRVGWAAHGEDAAADAVAHGDRREAQRDARLGRYGAEREPRAHQCERCAHQRDREPLGRSVRHAVVGIERLDLLHRGESLHLAPHRVKGEDATLAGVLAPPRIRGARRVVSAGRRSYGDLGDKGGENHEGPDDDPGGNRHVGGRGPGC